MKTTLNQLRLLVVAQTRGSSGSAHAAPSKSIPEHEWLKQLPAIKAGLMDALDALVLSKKNNRLIKRHLQQAQRECISLLDLLPVSAGNTLDHSPVDLATRLCLESVLEHLLKTQSYYFNWDAFAPKQHTLNVAIRLEEHLPALKAGLKKKKVEEALQLILIDVFIRFGKLKDTTYQQLHYMETLQLSLIKLCLQIENTDFDDILLEHLIYYGFNENSFVMYCRQRMNNSLNQHFHAPAKYEQLCFFEKTLIAQQEKVNFIFSGHRKSVKTQLLELINAELNFLQKKQGYLGQIGGQGAANQAAAGYRVKLNLSADALAYLLRLLCESQAIEANPRTHLMDFAARSFQTAGIGDKILSAQSLGTKYKQVTQSTALGMKALLQKMLKQVVKDDF